VRLTAFTANAAFINHADAGAVAAQVALGKIDGIFIRSCIV
jgi:hypothetical protein